MSDAKVSAFAKRWRLNNGSAVEAPSSDSSLSSVVKTKTATTRKNSKKREAIQAEPLFHTSQVDDSEILPGENSFEPLVEAQVVKFTGIREIEDVGHNSCKIRLSRGQECSFVGIANLWVRDGAVEVYGAVLHESPRVYTIFAPYFENAASIVPLSKTAEFQLESVEADDPMGPSPLHLPRRLRFKENNLSFQIVDFKDGPVKVSRGTNPRDDRSKRLLHPFTSINNACILICGKRSSSTARLSNQLINAVLSNPTTYHAEKGIAFLDLDSSLPTRTTPGTVSLIYQRGLMLGPAFAYPVHESDELSNLVFSIYVGSAADDGGAEILATVETMLKSHPEMREMRLVVRTGKWLATASTSMLTKLRKILCPSSVLSVDNTTSSSFYEAAVTLAEDDTELERVPELTTSFTPSLTEHRHNLKSHFMFHGYVNDVPNWFKSNTDLPGRLHLQLQISPDISQLKFLLLSGGMVRSADICDTLTASLVTIVARDSTAFDQDASFQIQPFHQGLSLRYIGIAFVELFDDESGTVKLITNVTDTALEQQRAAGRVIGVVLEKPGPEGQFSRHMLRD